MLTKQPLADAYAQAYRHHVLAVCQKPVQAHVWATDLGGGWIKIRGESLPPHRDLVNIYPNGWSLCGLVRYGEARQFIADTEFSKGRK